MHKLLRRAFCFLLLLTATAVQAVELAPNQSLDNVFDSGVLFTEDQVDLGDAKSIAAAGELLEQALGEQPAPIAEIPKGSWIGIPIHNVGSSPGYWRLDTEMAAWSFTSRAYLVKEGVAELVFDAPGLELGVHQEVSVDRGQEVVASDVIALNPGEAAIVWFQYAIPSASWERVRLATLEEFSTNRVWDGQKYGLFFGAQFILTVFFFAFSLVLRSLPALYYGLFFLGLLVLGLALEGLLLVRVDFTLGSDFVILSMVARIGSSVAYLQFMRSFLKTKVNQPRLDRVVQAFCWASPAVLAWNIWGYSDLSAAVIAFAVLLFAVFQMIGGVIAYRSRIPGANWYLVGTVLVFGIMIITFLTLTDVLKWPTRLSNDIAYLLGLADGLIFGGAIVTQAFALRHERDSALQNAVAAAEERLAATETMLAAVQERDSAVQLADQRRQRLAAASHDLRQPLLSLEQSIKQLDADDQATDQLRDQLNTGLTYLNSVVGDNLDETRPEPVESEEAMEELGVELLFNNLKRMFSGDAAAKGLEFRLRESDLNIQGQPIDLIRMLVNLTANAIKFTNSGGVLVAARKRGLTAALEVWDTGIGLDPDDTQRLLEPYQTGDDDNSGEGLGLAIVRDLAQANGYRFAVKSRLGRGTVMSINDIPLA